MQFFILPKNRESADLDTLEQKVAIVEKLRLAFETENLIRKTREWKEKDIFNLFFHIFHLMVRSTLRSRANMQKVSTPDRDFRFYAICWGSDTFLFVDQSQILNPTSQYW